MRLGKLVGSLLVDGVLCGENEERLRQRVGAVAQSDLPLLHRLQKCGLHLGRRAVDFIGKDQVVENGAEFRLEFHFLRVIDHRPHEVGRQKVRRELESGESGGKRTGKGFHRERLGQPRNTLQQDMTIA